jgi:indolepyruvate ferredoxin oxidoreductase beta subunit
MTIRTELLADPAGTTDPTDITTSAAGSVLPSGSVLIVGVGGQGVIMASNIIADVALSNGLDVKNAEVHGMSQRGGMVTSQVRFGAEVYSTLMEPGTADFVVALEWAEALRSFAFLAPTGMLIASSQRIIPPAALSNRVTGRFDYPLEGWTDPRALRVDARGLAQGAGDVRAAATVLLGVLSNRMPFPVKSWREALKRWAPVKALQANERSFELGRGWRTAEAAPAATKTGRPPELETTSSVTVNASWCKGAACSICVDVCPERVFVMGPEGFAVPANAQRCTGCNLCMKLCPDFAIEVAAIEAGEPKTGVSGARKEVRNG